MQGALASAWPTQVLEMACGSFRGFRTKAAELALLFNDTLLELAASLKQQEGSVPSSVGISSPRRWR
jgi:hypothetical protein